MSNTIKLVLKDNKKLYSWHGQLTGFFRLSMLMAITFFAIENQIALAEETLFYKQCHEFLPLADEFASECLLKARPFERTFYPSGGSQGQPESFSAYFRSLAGPSRFLLGCVLNFKHQLLYVGMYYSHKLINLSKLNEYPIDFIDFDANVGLDVDRSQLTLIAVRQFATNQFQQFRGGYVKNCEPADLEFFDGQPPKSQYGGHYHIQNNIAEMYGNDGGYAGSISVQNYNGFHVKSLIFVNSLSSIMVDEQGVLLLERQIEDRDTIKIGNLIVKRFNSCLYQKSDYRSIANIIYEMCPKNQNK